MDGETTLSKVISSLQISCNNIQYGFASIKDVSLDNEVLGTFKEDEGLTVVAPLSYFQKNNIQFNGPYAKLTVEVHTSLQLVALTAVLASKLAENNISSNVFAAYYHDHIFVQYELRDKAIAALNNLKENQAVE